MKLFSANIEDLRSLYVTDLRRALDMEQKIARVLPDMVDNSTDPELTETFLLHLEETRGHVIAVEGLLRDNAGDVPAETSKAIGGLITSAFDTMKDVTDTAVRDIALIGQAQQVEHHEIAVYGTLRRWAELLGLDNDATVLEALEAEEEDADERLTEISERVNLVAANLEHSARR